MGKKTRITFPNGAVVEIDESFSPAQIKAVIEPFVANSPQPIEPKVTPVVHIRDFDEVWQSSKKEKLALFIRNTFAESLWITSKMILEEQINEYKSLFLGERPALGTYLKRLHEEGYLDRRENGNLVFYKQGEKLITEYPRIAVDDFKTIIINSLNQ